MADFWTTLAERERSLRRPRYRLFDVELEEISFVDRGDNPGANILFTKRRDEPLVTDAEIEALIDEEITKGDDVTTTTLPTRTTVVQEATRLAQEKLSKGEASSIEAARAQVWRERRDLAEAHATLPAEPPQSPAAPVLKGSGVVEAIDVVAGRIRKENPELSAAQARMRAWRERPDLRLAYREATTGR